jgi:hypothetical protein
MWEKKQIKNKSFREKEIGIVPTHPVTLKKMM